MGRWVALLRQGEAAPNFLKKDWFVAGLWLLLREKVRGRFPANYDAAIEVARLKDRKLHLQAQNLEFQQEGKGARLQQQPVVAFAQHNQQEAESAVVNDQQELLSQITSQLESLSFHLVQQGNPNPPNQGQGRRNQ